METSRGGAAAATRIVRGDESRRRRRCDVDNLWETSRGDEIVRGDESHVATWTFAVETGARLRYTTVCVEIFQHFHCVGPYDLGDGREVRVLAQDFGTSCDSPAYPPASTSPSRRDDARLG